MPLLDGADPKQFEAIPDVLPLDLEAVSGPGSGYGFQGFNLAKLDRGV